MEIQQHPGQRQSPDVQVLPPVQEEELHNALSDRGESDRREPGQVHGPREGNNFANFNRSKEELEIFFFFCVAVAGKTSRVLKPAVNAFFAGRHEGESPYEYLRILRDRHDLYAKLQAHRIGQYRKLIRFILYVLNTNLDLRTCSLEQLELCPGVGPKTARFFMLYTRPNQELAVLDTHILAFLNDHGYPVPHSTPQDSKKYRKIEEFVLHLAKAAGVSPVNFDDYIWNLRSKRLGVRTP